MSSSERTADLCLATYGSLAPGRINHCKLAGLQGSWRHGAVSGRLVAFKKAISLVDPAGGHTKPHLIEILLNRDVKSSEQHIIGLSMGCGSQL
jgi:hypothetical protein